MTNKSEDSGVENNYLSERIREKTLALNLRMFDYEGNINRQLIATQYRAELMALKRDPESRKPSNTEALYLLEGHIERVEKRE